MVGGMLVWCVPNNKIFLQLDLGMLHVASAAMALVPCV